MTWVDNSFEEAGFRIERSIAEFEGWTPVAIANANQTAYQDTGLNCNTLTYYRVKSYGIGVDSTYSNAASVKTAACTPPIAPSLVLPVNTALLANQTPLLSWIPLGGGISFDVQIDNAADFLTAEVDVAIGSSSFRPITPLLEGTYYWRVRAENNLAQKGNWSAIYYFTVDVTAPNPPTLTIPTEALFHANRPTLTWNASPGTAYYEVQVDIHNPPTSTIVTTPSLNHVPAFALLYDTYYWRMRAIDAAGNISDWSEIHSFTILIGDGSRPVIRFFASDTATLSWNSVSWSKGYEVEVDNDPSFSSPDFQNNSIPADISSISTTSLADGIWYWHVRAQRPDGTWTQWGVIDTFAINVP